MFSPVSSLMTDTHRVGRSVSPWTVVVRFWWRTMSATPSGALRPLPPKRPWDSEQTTTGTVSVRSRLAGHDRSQQARPRLGHRREGRRLHADHALSWRVAGEASGGAT